jgi:uncharacterized caspase-like protein
MKFFLIFIFSVLVSMSQIHASKKYALIIGSNYKGNTAGISELNLCEADASYMEAQVKKLGDFEQIKILLGREVTKNNIKREIDDLAKKAKPEDTVFFYFAGHGSFERDAGAKNGMRNYIICYDRPHLSDDELNEYMQKVKSPKTLLAFDCCYSGGIAKKGSATRGNSEIPVPAGKDGVLRQDPEDFYFQGKAIIASSDSDQTSIELGGNINHGVFTYHFGRAMETADLNGDKVVTALEAFFQTKDAVKQMAARVNHNQDPQISGNASGIYLKGTKDEVQPPPQKEDPPNPPNPPGPGPDVDPPKPDPVKPVVTPDEPPVIESLDYGDLLIRTTIIVDRRYALKDVKAQDIMNNKRLKGKRQIRVLINDKEYSAKVSTRQSAFWGVSSVGGSQKKGEVYDVLFKQIPAGVHKITVQADDYPEYHTTFAVLKNNKNILDLENSMSGYGAIHGRLFYKTLDNPVIGQAVYMPTVKSVSGVQRVVTDSEGNFWFSNLAPGKYEIKPSFAETIKLEDPYIEVREGKVHKVQVILNVLVPGSKTKYKPVGDDPIKKFKDKDKSMLEKYKIK